MKKGKLDFLKGFYDFFIISFNEHLDPGSYTNIKFGSRSSDSVDTYPNMDLVPLPLPLRKGGVELPLPP